MANKKLTYAIKHQRMQENLQKRLAAVDKIKKDLETMERDRYKNWCKDLTKLIEKNSAKINLDKIEPEAILNIMIENCQKEKSICLTTAAADTDESKNKYNSLEQENDTTIEKFSANKEHEAYIKNEAWAPPATYQP